MQDFVRRVGHVLGAANSRPVNKPEFYAVKDVLCRFLGTPIGFDYQRIVHKCWNCDGHGSLWDGDCYRCDNTGIYDSVVVELARIRLGERVFHRPLRRLPYAERKNVTIQIDGIINHEPVSWWRAANVSIGRLFDVSYYWLCLKETPPELFGLIVKQSENLSRWVLQSEWHMRRHAIPCARTLLFDRGLPMSP